MDIDNNQAQEEDIADNSVEIGQEGGTAESIINSTTAETSATSTTTAEDNTINSVSLCVTPGGSEIWMRNVGLEYTPSKDKLFATVEAGIKFYEIYAMACGFDIRLYNQTRFRDSTIQTKSIVCNKHGFKEDYRKSRAVDVESSTLKPNSSGRQQGTARKEFRIGCKAHIRFAAHLNNKGKLLGYTIDRFYEWHNHPLCPLKHTEFLKRKRNLTLYHMQTIVDHGRINIGPTTTFRVMKEYSKGYDKVGATLTDFKNFQRDIKCLIGMKDAQMFIDRFKKLAETSDFYFAYHVENNCLTRIFWCDETAKKNYSLFGDVVSFDPTYSTNKYCMVFTPFTGVDNHKKSVTFGAALLSNEDELSFKWVFDKFLTAMGGKEPQCIITDQDPALKNAIPRVFTTAYHRLCMWHIMEKLCDKVGPVIARGTEFVNDMTKVVWNIDLETAEFEDEWLKVIARHDIKDNSWLSHMFSIRDKWIPAYFTHLPMACILRTTQRSESENSFFKRFENEHGTLVEFWLRFESAMDQQRYSQKKLDHENATSNPKLLTPLKIESHARRIYTHAVFLDFQLEVEASMCKCGLIDFKRKGNNEVTKVEDAVRRKTYTVRFNNLTDEATCSCKMYIRIGLLCRHIIWVLCGKRKETIPEQYVAARWTKNVNKRPLVQIDGKHNMFKDFDDSDVTDSKMSNLWSEFYETISVLPFVQDSCIDELATRLKQFREKIRPLTTEKTTKQQTIEDLLGCKAPKEISVLPPVKSNNKGSGKRLISEKELCIQKAKRNKRRCNNCKRMTYHDKRTCTRPYAEHTPEPSDGSGED